MAKQWSEEQIEALAAAVFRGLAPKCPLCGTPVQGRLDGGRGGTPLEEVELHCPRCQKHGRYVPNDDLVRALRPKWTHAQKVKMVERYWASGGRSPGPCPACQSILRVARTRTIGDNSFFVRCPRCGRTFSSDQVKNEPDPETLEGQYEEERVLQKGGMGEVALARKRGDMSGALYAVKKVLPRFIKDVDVVRRFEREKRIYDRLDHPHIVPIRDLFLDDRGGAIVMDYMPNGDLMRAINDFNTTNETLVQLVHDVADGLAYLHQANVVHRDLKPMNILLDAESRARISDFGLSLMVPRDSTILTAKGDQMGTERYMAPELAVDPANATPAADVFAFALIAYEVATKRSPYYPPVTLSSLPSQLAEALENGLKQDWLQRTATPAGIARALEAHLLAPRA